MGRLRKGLCTGIAVGIFAASYYSLTNYLRYPVVVQGKSMAPTINDGAHCYLNCSLYHLRTPRRYEIAVIRNPGHKDYAVKRIIGMPGDVLLFTNGVVCVNGTKLKEPYLSSEINTRLPEKAQTNIFVIRTLEYFVMGDNRNNSEDSRNYGAVKLEQVVGMLVP